MTRRDPLAVILAATCAVWSIPRPSAQIFFPGSPPQGPVANAQPCVYPAVSRAAADERVDSLSDLMYEIARSSPGKPLAGHRRVIWIENTASFDLSTVTPTDDFVLRLPSNVTLASGRSPTELGGLLYFSQPLESPRFMIRMDGWCSRITGLRLRGPSRSTARTRPTDTRNVAIIVRSENRAMDDPEPQALIDNNEIFDWPGAGIHVGAVRNTYNTAQKVSITKNFIHHNLMCNQGYGVEVYGATDSRALGGYAFIDRNVFTYNRHAIAGDGHPATGFVAQRNLILSGGKTCHTSAVTSAYEQHFDMHGFDGEEAGYGGVAGERITIRYNTVRGEQEYGEFWTRPVFWLRGTPSVVAHFYGNVMAHDDRSEAIRNDADEGHFLDWNNRYDINTSDELAVGDFDGDGIADVFQATGTVWAYSARGRSDWRIINTRSETLPRLRFGDFDGNGTTDVFTQQGDRWLVSYGGTTGWRPLPFGSSIDISSYRVGDFDGDGKADIFRANGTQWSYSRGGAADWEPLAGSRYGVDDVQLGDFNGDGATDVLGIANGEWSVSYGGATTWQRLNDRIANNVRGLVVADFNRDGVSDIARQNGPDYEISWNGRQPWQTLHDNALQAQFQPLRSMLVGDFNGDRRADVLHYRRQPFADGLLLGPGERFVMSSRGSRPFVTWSRHEMR